MNLEPHIKLIDNFADNPDLLFTQIKESVIWDERLHSRKTASFGVAYNYSGMTYPQTAMLDKLMPLCAGIKRTIGFMPNNCLLNYYPDGNSKMGYHSDNWGELQVGTGVVIMSLGAERYIAYRHKIKPVVKHRYLLTDGSLLYMDKEVQKHWLHAIPKQQAKELA